jgi:gas vesicle protein
MTKVKYSGPGLVSVGIEFVSGRDYELTDDQAKYVLDTFGKHFTSIGAKKEEPKKVEEVVTEEVKEEAPKAKRPNKKG